MISCTFAVAHLHFIELLLLLSAMMSNVTIEEREIEQMAASYGFEELTQWKALQKNLVQFACVQIMYHKIVN